MAIAHDLSRNRATLAGACLSIGMLLALVPSPSQSEIGRDTPYQYVSPPPGARFVPPSHNIAIRDGRLIDRSTVANASLSVRGSRSGIHAGSLVLSDDGKTLVFVPDRPFTRGETVDVHLQRGPTTRDGTTLQPLSFRFDVSPADLRQRALDLMSPTDGSYSRATSADGVSRPRPAGDDLPPGYPDLYLVSSNNPEPGEIFITPFGFGAPPPPDNRGPLVIIDNQGMPLFYHSLEKGGLVFTPQAGVLTYWDHNREKFFVMDHAHAVIDSFEAGNGAVTDFHDLQLLPNGHALITAEEFVPVDMSKVIKGGDPNAIVIGAIVQILDLSKNVIFEWKSLDHIDILDAHTNWVDFTGPIINYFVINALDLDQDDHILVSGRALNQIIKVNSQTGDVIWRLGPNGANNSFTMVNDPRGTSGQHDIRRLPNGNITLYDNGNFMDPLYSRAVEYELDEVNFIATLVWEYRDVPDHFGRFMGGVQRREGGGTMIAWGGSTTHPKVTDLHADGTKALELSFTHDPGFGYGSYRAFRAPWQTTRFVTDVDVLDFGPVPPGDTGVQSLAITNNWGSDVVITSFVTTDPVFYVLDAVPLTIPVGESVDVDVVFEPGAERVPHAGHLYVRSVSDTTELVARRVELRGEEPVPVLLSGFTAESRDRTVLVSWFTSFETMHDGFNLYRSSLLESGYARLNRGLIRGRNPYSYIDKSVQPSSTYFYRLGAVDTNGHEVLHETTSVTTPAWGVRTTLSLASPTPFRTETLLNFTLAAPAKVNLAIYDVAGRMVRVVIDEDMRGGDHAATWDGRDGAGLRVGGGTYFVKLVAGDVTRTRKVVFLGGR